MSVLPLPLSIKCWPTKTPNPSWCKYHNILNSCSSQCGQKCQLNELNNLPACSGVMIRLHRERGVAISELHSPSLSILAAGIWQIFPCNMVSLAGMEPAHLWNRMQLILTPLSINLHSEPASSQFNIIPPSMLCSPKCRILL